MTSLIVATEDKVSGNWRLWHCFLVWNKKTKGDYAVWDEREKDMKLNGIHGEFRPNWLKSDRLHDTSLLSLWILTHSAASLSLDALPDYFNYRLSHLAPPKAPKAHSWVSIIECMLVCKVVFARVLKSHVHAYHCRFVRFFTCNDGCLALSHLLLLCSQDVYHYNC